eukprot:gene24333-biopygen19410
MLRAGRELGAGSREQGAGGLGSRKGVELGGSNSPSALGVALWPDIHSLYSERKTCSSAELAVLGAWGCCGLPGTWGKMMTAEPGGPRAAGCSRHKEPLKSVNLRLLGVPPGCIYDPDGMAGSGGCIGDPRWLGMLRAGREQGAGNWRTGEPRRPGVGGSSRHQHSSSILCIQTDPAPSPVQRWII